MATTTTDTVTDVTVNETDTTIYDYTTDYYNWTALNTTGNYTNSTNTTTATPLTTTPVNTDAILRTFFMGLIILLGFSFNLLFFIVYATVKRVQKPKNWFLVHLAVWDCIALFVWSLIAMLVSINDAWTLGDDVCQMQGFFSFLVYTINMHSFVVLHIERCLRIIKPSKHEEIFDNRIVTSIMIGCLLIFDIVLAMYPLIGWSQIKYSDKHYQCSIHSPQSLSHLNFTFVMTTIVPLAMIVFCWGMISRKLKVMKRNVGQTGHLVSEENPHVPTEDSYGQKFVALQSRLKLSPAKERTKRKVKKQMKSKDKDSSSSSSEDETTPKRKKRKRQYKFAQSDLHLTYTYLLIMCIVLILWIPFWIILYLTAYSASYLPTDGAINVIVWITHCIVFVKVPIYCIYVKYRKAFLERFRRNKVSQKYNEKEVGKDDPKDVHTESRAEIHDGVGDCET